MFRLETVKSVVIRDKPENKLAEGVTNRWPGVPVGKVIGFSLEKCEISQDLFDSLKWGRQVGRSAEVDCSIVEWDI